MIQYVLLSAVAEQAYIVKNNASRLQKRLSYQKVLSSSSTCRQAYVIDFETDKKNTPSFEAEMQDQY